MSDLRELLGAATYQEIVRAIRKEVLSKTEELLIDGQAEFEVEYKVLATVTLDFDDIEAAEYAQIGITETGLSIHVAASLEGRSEVDDDVIQEVIRDNLSYDIPEDLDDYRICVQDVEVEDFTLQSYSLSAETKERIAEWNAKVESSKVE